MENEIFERYVIFVEQLRFGRGFDRIEMDTILSKIRESVLLLGYVTKKNCLILINMPHDLEAGFGLANSLEREELEKAVADFMSFADDLLNEE